MRPMIRQILEWHAQRYLGTPYRWGGNTPILTPTSQGLVGGWDCSGLVLEMLQAGGVRGPGDTTADGLFKDTTMPAVGPGDLAQFGDLVFFGPNGKAGHVGFMLDDRLMLEAGGGQSSTVTVQDAANAGAYVRVRPVSRRKDLLGYRRPAWA